ncbi:MAG: hypothetical protein ACLFUE_03710 [Desulfobacteraceae bacterium]
MAQVLKRYAMWALLAGALYFLLSHHFIIVGSTVRLLDKSNLTLEYTFYSTKGKRISTILDVDPLRENGIGEILLDEGLITKDEYDRYLMKYRD